MKLFSALGLIILAIAGVSAESHLEVPVSLDTNLMGGVIKAAGQPGAAASDPTLTCSVDYVLGWNCSAPTGPCSVYLDSIDVTNCTITTP